MDIAIDRQGEVACLAAKGRLDTVSAPDFDRAAGALLDDGVRSILVDLGELEYISSAGLRSLLILGKKLGAAGGELALCGLNELVAKVFSVSGFDKLFVMCADRDEGMSRLS